MPYEVGGVTRPLTPNERSLLPLAVRRSQKFAVGYTVVVVALIALVLIVILPLGVLPGALRTWMVNGPIGVLVLVPLMLLFVLPFQIHTSRTYRNQVNTVLSDGEVREVSGIAHKTTYRGKWVTVRSFIVDEEKLSLDDDGMWFDRQTTRTFRLVREGSDVRIAFVLAHHIRDNLAVGWLISVDGQGLPSPQRITWDSPRENGSPATPLLTGDLATAIIEGKLVFSIQQVDTIMERPPFGSRSVMLVGAISGGSVRPGEKLQLQPGPGSPTRERVVEVSCIFSYQRPNRALESAASGEKVMIHVRDLGPTAVRRGDLLVTLT